MTRRVLAAAAALTLLVGCPEDPVVQPDGGTPDGGTTPAWQVVFEEGELDRAVLSVWGTAPDDVFVVGGPLGNEGFETLALHFDGTSWTDLAPGGGETFWWVGGTASNDVWMVGTGGRIAHWDGATFTEHDSGTTGTLWGVWARAADDAWAVGGTPEGGTAQPNDIVLHWDGTSWTPVTLPGEPRGRAHYKVWGASSDDLYVVGEAGTVWHKRGSDWALEADGLAMATLFTVYGCSADEVYAVGGRDVLRSDGSEWSRVDIDLSNDVNGVGCNRPGEAAIVGFGGLKQRLVEGTWIDEFDIEPYTALHATWGDGQGFWAVGGDWLSSPKPAAREGVVARFGPGTVGDALAP